MAIPVLETDWVGTSGGAGAVSSLTLTKPAGTSNGDLLLLMLGDDQDNATSPLWNTPADWSGPVFSSDGNDASVTVFWKEADGTEGSTINVTRTASDESYGWYARVSGADATAFNASLATAGSAGGTYTIDGVTTDVADCLIIAVMGEDGGDGGTFTINTGAGWSIEGQLNAGTSGTDAAGLFASRDQATSGAGVDLLIDSGVTDGKIGIQFAIAPPVSGSTGSGTIDTTVPTLSGSGELEHTSSGAIDITVPTLSGAGHMSRDATGAVTTTVPALSGAGEREITSSGAITSPVPTLSGDGDIAVEHTGSGAIDTTVPVLSGDGGVTKTATGAVDTTVPTLSGTGKLSRDGAGAVDTTVSLLAGDATVTKTSDGAINLTIPLLVGSAAVGGNISGSGAVDAPVPALSGVATITKTASGAVNLSVPVLDGAATITKTASGAIDLTVPLLVGSGGVGGNISGSGGIDTVAPVVSGAGGLTKTASGDIDLTVPLLSGSGVVGSAVSGSGVINITTTLLTGAATITKTSSGAVNLTIPLLSGSADITKTSSGAISLTVPLLSGSGSTNPSTTTGSGSIDLSVPLLSGDGLAQNIKRVALAQENNFDILMEDGEVLLTELVFYDTEIVTGSGGVTLPQVQLLGEAVTAIMGGGGVVAPLIVTDGFVLVGDITLSGATIITTSNPQANVADTDADNTISVSSDNNETTNHGNSVVTVDTTNEAKT